MQKNTHTVSDRVIEGHRKVSIVLDRCLGPFALLVAVLSVVRYFQGQVSTRCMIALVAMPVLNILATNVLGLRMKNPFHMELARNFGMNSILGTCAFIFGEGDFALYWPVYLTCAIFGAVILFTWTRNLYVCYAQTGYWVTLLFFANLYLGQRGMYWVQFAVAASVTTLIPLILIHMLDLLTESLENEDQARSHLVNTAKMAALGEMAGGIAHEINTPLAVIGLHSEQLLEIIQQDEGLDRVQLKESLGTISKTTARIAKIVTGLRSFSRDGSHDAFQGINVRQLVEETIGLCSEQLRNSGVNIIVDNISKDLLLYGRSVEISQVLLNLIGNARDAVQNSPAKWIKISVSERAEMIEFQIIDSGPGITLEIQKKIFQPFFTTKEIGQGTGLGLSVSLGIVKKHNGKLVFNANSVNTCFLLQLPKFDSAARKSA